MATFNYVVLVFVLVLFGSVVPASAQDLQEYGGILQTVVAGVSASFGVVVTLLTFWWKFDKKIEKLGDKIDANTRETNGKIETTRTELKEDSRIAHEAIGTNIRDSEKRVNENINKLHATVNDNNNKLHATVQLLLKRAMNQTDA